MPTTFADLGVPDRLCRRLANRGIAEPFPVQAATLPEALGGRDVSGGAPTGSGKTIAFGLVTAAGAGAQPTARRPRALVLAPTRELAQQIRTELTALHPKGAPVLAVYGGVGYGPQRRALAKGVDTVVACPGRLEDLLGQGAIDLGAVEIAVVDEADRMADMGFLPAVKRILDQTAPDRQTLLFSATLDGAIDAIVRRYQRDPVRHVLESEEDSLGADVTHQFLDVERHLRLATAAKLVADHGQAMVFCRTRHGTDRVARQLKAAGVSSAPIHGNRSQGQRTRALAAFTAGQVAALVATDVAARGIHVDDVDCVIHFDPPPDPKDYLHRSGRTGRAGRPGAVFTLVTDADEAGVGSLRRALGLDAGERRSAAPAAAASPAREASHTPRPTRTGPRVREAAQGNQRGRHRRPAATSTRGTVKSFDPRKGYGFIAVEEGGDLFVHFSAIESKGFRTLTKGQRVTYDTAPGRKGPQAANVRPL